MLFKQLSAKWAERICRAAGETDSYKIALTRYVFESILSFWLSVTILLIVAWLVGMVKTIFLIGFTGAFIKSFSGGLHMSTPLRCAVGGAIALVAVSYIATFLPITSIPWVIILLIMVVMNLIVWLNAPREAKGKPLTTKQKSILGVLAKIIILLISIICLLWTKNWGVNELFYGTVFQVINLLDLAAQGIEKVDCVFGKIERKPVF